MLPSGSQIDKKYNKVGAKTSAERKLPDGDKARRPIGRLLNGGSGEKYCPTAAKPAEITTNSA